MPRKHLRTRKQMQRDSKASHGSPSYLRLEARWRRPEVCLQYWVTIAQTELVSIPSVTMAAILLSKDTSILF